MYYRLINLFLLLPLATQTMMLDNNLRMAIRNNDIELVQTLIELNANIEHCDKTSGGTHLFYAISCGFPEIVKILIDASANVNAINGKNGSQLSVLHYTTRYIKDEIEDKTIVELVELLLNAKANTEAVDYRGYTPLHHAATENASLQLKTLIKYKSDLNSTNALNDFMTPLHAAALANSAEALELLLEANAQVNVYNTIGYSPLHYSAECGFPEVVKKLLDANSNLEAKTTLGKSVIDLALDEKYEPSPGMRQLTINAFKDHSKKLIDDLTENLSNSITMPKPLLRLIAIYCYGIKE